MCHQEESHLCVDAALLACSISYLWTSFSSLDFTVMLFPLAQGRCATH